MSTEAELERMGLVPSKVRDFVIERDGQCCRVCGRYVEHPALHHVVFRSHGGLDVPSNLVTVGWQPGHDCHLPICHGPEARLFRDLLLEIADEPARTALAVRRQREGTKGFRMELVIERFWAHVDADVDWNECWTWNGSLDANGYGQLSARAFSQRPIKAHRMGFFLYHRRWPKPMCLHTCDNPPCVNPFHLYEGDQLQNMADRKARKPRFGDANPAAKHGPLVEQIRSRVAAGESQADVARSLHLNSAVVSRIFRHVNFP